MRAGDQLAPPPAPTSHDQAARPSARRRRGLIVAAVLVVVAVVGAGAFALLGGDDDSTTGADDDWNVVAVLEADTNTVEVRDESGTTVDEIEITVDDANSLSVRGRYALVAHDADDDSDKRVAVVDLAEATATTIENPTAYGGDHADDGWSIDWVPGSRAPVLLEVSRSGGSNLSYRMTDVATGETAEFDVTASASGTVVGTADGQRLLLAPNGSWTTLAGLGLGDTELLRGPSVAVVTDDVVITSSEGQYFVYDAGRGTERDSFIAPDAIGVSADGDGDEDCVLIVDRDGHLLRASPDRGDPAEVADLGFGDGEAPTGVFFLSAIDRIVLAFDDEIQVFAEDGTPIATVEGTITTAVADPAATRCGLVADDDTIRLVDAVSGDVMAESMTRSIDGVMASNDGCTIAHESPDGPQVLTAAGADGEGTDRTDGTDAGVIDLDEPASAVAPDGRAVVVRHDDEWEIVDVADPSGDDDTVRFVGDAVAFGAT